MADMLRKHTRNHGDFGCCDHCSRNVKVLSNKPGPRERHLARQREKVATRKEIADQLR